MLVKIMEQNREEILTANSRDVAEHFEKQHKDVLESIRNLTAENSATKSMFIETSFESRGKFYPQYELTRDGFSLLVMGFTGSKALEWKLKYIEAFNEMELEQFDKNNLTDEDLDFIKKLYKGVVGEYSDLENRVGELSKGFKIDRVFKVDKAVLMMAIFELDNLDTPKSVVINEAVELAKKFSTEFSANFVNGVLGAYAKD